MLKNWKNIKVGEDDYGRLLETKNISENLTITVTLTNNERKKLLKVDYMKGKFTIDRNFLNTYGGNQLLQETIDSFDSEEKLKKYWRL